MQTGIHTIALINKYLWIPAFAGMTFSIFPTYLNLTKFTKVLLFKRI
jgi:hypothetical protein